MSEKIDVFDTDMNYLDSVSRDLAHKYGLWHKTVHCWVVSEKLNSILIQKRGSNVSFPDFLDISAAGHLKVKETSEEGLREINEELGFNYEKEDLYFLGSRIEMTNYNKMRNREFQYIYLLKKNLSLDTISPDKNEVSGLMWLNTDVGIKLFNNEIDNVNLKLHKYEKNKKNETIDFLINKESFVPRNLNYYKNILIMAQRLISKDFPLSV
ncbi:NUDIX hydrolase [Xanthomarina sp. F2636L]|uniref:NUDIX hydrolase n=1 Tax=Xanthomarina sp. F2636L TaxID=2996018 RepID=UPI00225DD33F|nr:NUDIX domain-containing protein [Xanthomarina sp. F2636L]MCX7549669.1 NUDIX domain-containing protein [Xanthomarina sp. F2636L]